MDLTNLEFTILLVVQVVELHLSFESMEELDRLAVDIVIVVVPELMVVPLPVVVQRLIVVPQLIVVLVPTKPMLVQQPMVELKHIMVEPKPIMVVLVQLVRELDSSSNCIR